MVQMSVDDRAGLLHATKKKLFATTFDLRQLFCQKKAKNATIPQNLPLFQLKKNLPNEAFLQAKSSSVFEKTVNRGKE